VDKRSVWKVTIDSDEDQDDDASGTLVKLFSIAGCVYLLHHYIHVFFEC
jgi:hypothetical protein